MDEVNFDFHDKPEVGKGRSKRSKALVSPPQRGHERTSVVVAIARVAVVTMVVVMTRRTDVIEDGAERRGTTGCRLS